MSDPIGDSLALSLTVCDREEIHIPGSVQPHGVLLTLDAEERRILQAGGDTLGLLGAAALSLLGRSVEEVFPDDHHQAVLRQFFDGSERPSRPLYAFTTTAPNNEPADVFAHWSDSLLVLEFEPRRTPNPVDALEILQRMVHHLSPQPALLQTLFDRIVAVVHAATGFDLIMLYRFDADGSGVVEAEICTAGAASFQGLHFPASDIPKQARVLYMANPIRCIADARYAPSVIVPPLNPLNEQPLDLSQSILRSVSPVHRQYLANMGVVASMSLSLIVRGRLWGLIACHHNGPRYLPHRLRDVCRLFAEMTSSYLDMKVSETDLEDQLRKAHTHEQLLARMNQEADLANALTKFHPHLLDLISAGGVGMWIEGIFSSLGTVPSTEQVAALIKWLNDTAADGLFHTDCLAAHYPAAREFAQIASGLLAVSISRMPRDYILWFRPELITTVSWAGNPSKPAELSGELLTPRASFAQWQESVRLHAPPWLAVELDAAHRLRVSLLEIVVRRLDQLAREREAARQEQQKLAAELDRRLEEWQATAQALRQESERKAVLEAELSDVLRRTVSDQEAERQRIARELHDTLGQSLTLLQLGLEGIGHSELDSVDFRERLMALKGLVAQFGGDLNRLAWEIRQTALDDLGIETAIRNLVETWSERTGIAFDLHLTLNGRRLPIEIETVLYRVLQEALTNIVRHARATQVGVVLGVADQLVTMIIDDDGRGFSADAAADSSPAKRLGLLGIRERLALVGGSLEVESTPGAGTTLFVRIPL